MINKAKELFEIVKSIGHGINGKIHIIDIDDYNLELFRVYHGDGYCFDIHKRELDDDDESWYEEDCEKIDGFEYSFYSDWSGFKKLTVEQAIKLLL